MHVFVIGYPSTVGGAGTELWHTLKLWRGGGIDVTLIPTWGGCSDEWRKRVDGLGCKTLNAHHTPRDPNTMRLSEVPGLEGSPVVSFCGGSFLKDGAAILKQVGAKLVWVNCMTFLFNDERIFYDRHGLFDAWVFQSEYQRSRLEPELIKHGYTPNLGHSIRGAFDFSDWAFRPLPRHQMLPFFYGRAARDDADKWSSNFWTIYDRVQVKNKRAVLLGYGPNVTKKLGPAPKHARVYHPGSMHGIDFFKQLHCALPINGGAHENWPRAGLEAMAQGVPIVTQGEWGWREMLVHGKTGFLATNDEELAHWTATMAYDEHKRQEVAHAARSSLENELANPAILFTKWQKLFNGLASSHYEESINSNSVMQSV